MRKNYGFSIVEILTVFVIAGILVSAAVPSYRARIIKEHVSTNLLPVIQAYQNKLTSLIKAYPPGTCVIDQMDNFDGSLSNMVNGVGVKEVSGQYIIQVSAKMKTSVGNGIGIKSDPSLGRPVILEMKLRQNGEAIISVCSSEKAYSDFVPNICQEEYGITTSLLPNVTVGSCAKSCYIWKDSDLDKLGWHWDPASAYTSENNCKNASSNCNKYVNGILGSCYKWASCSACPNSF